MVDVPQPKCIACSDTKKVADACNQMRPCSRCDAEGFNRWSAARAPTASEERAFMAREYRHAGEPFE